MEYWQYLHTLLECRPSHVEPLLQRPCLAPLPDIEFLDDLLAAAEGTNLADLLRKHLLSSLAQNAHPVDGASEVLQRLLVSVFPQLQLAPVEKIPWLVMPLPVVQGTGGKLIYFLAGLLPHAQGVHSSGALSADSMRYTERVFELYTAIHPDFSGSLILMPLRNNDSTPVTGGSLGLPLALALHLLRSRRKWPEGFYTSGCLDVGGNVLPVEGLEEKRSVLENPRCLFLAPADAERYLGKAYAKPVATLTQALEELDFILLGEDPEKAALFRLYLHSPRNFLGHFDELPTVLLRHDKSRKILAEIKSKPTTYLPQVTNALYRCTYEPSRAATLTALYDDGQQLEIPAVDDETTEIEIFEYSLARIAHANHIGDTAAAETWKKIQHRHRESITSGDKLLAHNHHFVAERFNRFAFRNDIPPEIVDLLDKTEQKNEITSDADKILGAMYGTLCQNFGFCGPGYVADLLACKEKAARAFNRKFRVESGRLENYEFYGRLEARDTPKALQALNRYLELPETAETDEWLRILKEKIAPGPRKDLFKVAAILRVLVDLEIPLSAGKLKNIHSMLYANLPAAGHHPWQFILFNLARFLAAAGQENAVVLCLDKMVNVCNLGKETIQVMGLLAYSELYLQGLAEKRHHLAAEQLLKKMQQSHYLDQAHFASLYQPIPLQQKLQLLVDNRARFFPFTYR